MSSNNKTKRGNKPTLYSKGLSDIELAKKYDNGTKVDFKAAIKSVLKAPK